MISNLYTTNDMMKRINKFYYCILSLFLFTACQEEALMDKTAGFQISLQDGEVAIETKSTPVELGKPAVDKFKLKIVRRESLNRCTRELIPAKQYQLQPVLMRSLPLMGIILFWHGMRLIISGIRLR